MQLINQLKCILTIKLKSHKNINSFQPNFPPYHYTLDKKNSITKTLITLKLSFSSTIHVIKDDVTYDLGHSG